MITALIYTENQPDESISVLDAEAIDVFCSLTCRLECK